MSSVPAVAMEVSEEPGADNEIDEARPEATMRFTVENFSQVSDSMLSPPTMVRNLPWKIMVMPRSSNSGRSLGYFLQCNGESEASSWSCQAQAELRIVAQREDKKDFVRKISHLFYSKENDWGFSHYMAWNEVLDPENGYVQDDKVVFEVRVSAEAPHGVSWDSKKHTGYVGLKNQGATCYMNSLLQVLYFTNKLRLSVYKMPTEADDSATSVSLALQRVFYELQFNDKCVGTKKLTKSFGWETLDLFMQHDVQEFLRVLLDKLEMKMKGTSVEGTIPSLFKGETVSFVRCKNVDYTSNRTESFYDVQLTVKSMKNIYESFKDCVKTENLEGENKYDAGPEHGMQDAEKGITFSSFPPVLYLHLMRFQYDPATDSCVKFNDRFEFPYELDLSEFLNNGSDAAAEGGQSEREEAENNNLDSEDAMDVDNNNDGTSNAENDVNGTGKEDSPKKSVDDTTDRSLRTEDDTSVKYILHAVLVHSGDNHGGHYVVFINPKGDGKWCKFDDDVVSRCSEKEAIQNNFGGNATEDDVIINSRQSTNAYMLVYIRKSKLKQILCPVPEEAIPEALVDRLSEEKRTEILRRKEKSEAHLYLTLRMLFEDDFCGHQGNDLYDAEQVVYKEFRVKKADTLRRVMEQLSEHLKVPAEELRLWPLLSRSNHTMRPSLLDAGNGYDRCIQELADNGSTWTVFLEMSPIDKMPESFSKACIAGLDSGRALSPFDKEQDVLLLFKYYDPEKEKIFYMGHLYVCITTRISRLIPVLCRRANLEENTELMLFEEIKPNMLERIEDTDKPLEHGLEELMDGDILVYQKKLPLSQLTKPNETCQATTLQPRAYRLPFARDYFRDLFYKIDITFVDRAQLSDAGFTLTLSLRMSFLEMVNAVAAKIDFNEPDNLQFFKPSTFRESAAGNFLRCPPDLTLKEIFTGPKPRHKKLFYQKLGISVKELETNKRVLKCSYLSTDHKEERELTLYPSRNGNVAEILNEARKYLPLKDDSRPLRLLEISSHKIVVEHTLDTRVEHLSTGTISTSQSKNYRVEIVPEDQVGINQDIERLVTVVHFQKEVYSTFGHPFLIKIADNESVKAISDRIRRHLDVPEKEFEKYRLAIVTLGSKPKYLADEQDSAEQRIRISEFAPFTLPNGQHAKPCIGLEHVNKNSKRARYNYMEKSVKIYN